MWLSNWIFLSWTYRARLQKPRNRWCSWHLHWPALKCGRNRQCINGFLLAILDVEPQFDTCYHRPILSLASPLTHASVDCHDVCCFLCPFQLYDPGTSCFFFYHFRGSKIVLLTRKDSSDGFLFLFYITSSCELLLNVWGRAVVNSTYHRYELSKFTIPIVLFQFGKD